MTNDLKGTVWNALGSVMWGLQTFVMLMMVSRTSDTAQTGCFGIAFTTAQILYIAGQFGVSHYQMTDYDEKYSFRSYFLSRCVSGALMLIGCGAVLALMGFSGDKLLYTVFLTLLMLVNVFGDIYQSLFFQKNRLDLSGSALFYRTLVSLIVFCAVIALTKNILLSIIAQTAVNIALTAFYALSVAPAYITRSGSRGSDELRAIITECFPLFISMLFMNLVINMSKYVVDIYLDDSAQGYINMLFMPVQVINLLSQFIFKPYLNRYASALKDKDLTVFRKLLTRQICLVIALTAVCCAGSWLIGAPVLSFIYDKDISAYAVHLLIIVFGSGVYAICDLLYYIFVIIRRQKTVMGVYIFTLAVSVAAAVVFIKKYGVLGAALSFTVTHIILLVCYAVFLSAAVKNTVKKTAGQ